MRTREPISLEPGKWNHIPAGPGKTVVTANYPLQYAYGSDPNTLPQLEFGHPMDGNTQSFDVPDGVALFVKGNGRVVVSTSDEQSSEEPQTL